MLVIGKTKTTFLIDSNYVTGAKGGTLTITPGKPIAITTPNVDAYNKKIDDGIKDLGKSKGEIINDILTDEGVSQATLAERCKKELDKLKKDYEKLIKTVSSPIHFSAMEKICTRSLTKINLH